MKKPSLNVLLKDPNEVSIWKRGFAFLIDMLILELIVNVTFSSYIEKNIGDMGNIIEMYRYLSENYELFAPFLLTMSIISAFIALIYFTLLEWKLQQTIGKMIFKIKVNPKIEFWQALVRNLPKSLFFISYTYWVFLFDIFYLAFTRQRFFDKIARTSLVKVK